MRALACFLTAAVAGIDFWLIYTAPDMTLPRAEIAGRNIRLHHMGLGEVMERLVIAATGSSTNGLCRAGCCIC